MEELDVNTYYPIGTVGLVNSRRVIVQVSSDNNCDICALNDNDCEEALCYPSRRKDRKFVTFILLD